MLNTGTIISQLSALQIEEKSKLQVSIPYHFDVHACNPFAKYYVMTAGRETGIFNNW